MLYQKKNSPPNKLKTKLACSVLAFIFLISAVSIANAKNKFFSGSLSNQYRFRSAGGSSDQRLETILTLDFGNQNFDKISGAIQGGAVFDLSGKTNSPLLYDIYDTFDSNAIGRLYYGYVNINDLGPIDHIRIGRQHIYRTANYYFDGISFETVPLAGVTVSVYGGVPVHLFENQIGVDPGDWIAGASLQWNPIAKVRLRFDYTHIKDKIGGFRLSAGNTQDDLLGVSLWIDPTDNIHIFSKFTTFTDQVRDGEVSATFSFPKKKFTLRTSVYRLFEIEQIRVIDWDMYSFAGAYRPYTQIGFNMTKGFGKHFTLDGGFSARILDASQAGSAFNHGFQRVFLSFLSHDALSEGLDINLAFDYYHGSQNTLKNNYFGGSFSVSKRFKFKERKYFQLAAGTAYYLYRFNLLLGDESNDVQTYFGGVEWRIINNFLTKANYEFEHNDIANFHTLKIKMVWDF